MNNLITESPPKSQHPDILQVIGRRVDLRRRGKEFTGLCPFHADKTPSFSVNDDKGLYYCHACGEGGDAIDFIRKLDGLSFPQVLKSLGMGDERPRRPALTPSRQRAAELAAAWSSRQRAKFGVMIADAMEQRDLADEIGNFDLAENFGRELVVLGGFYDALDYPSGVAEMLALRPAIEALTDGAEVSL